MKKKVSLILTVLLALSACTSISRIVPQIKLPAIALPRLDNHALPAGKDIEQANNFLAAGKRREAASAYFEASRNYRSPERERLALQAAELAAIIKDSNLAQRYLSQIHYPSLNTENQARFRFTQGQLALNDKNFRETLRILPQRVRGLPSGLASKILNARMRAAQSSRDRISLVQELVLQEPNLKNDYEVKLNHDRIWNHINQIPRQQLESSKRQINHPELRSWLELGYLARTARSHGEISSSARSSLLNWQRRNPNHPGKSRAQQLLKSKPTATVTPYKGSKTRTPKTSTATEGNSIAVILPTTGKLSSLGNTILNGIRDAHKRSSSGRELKVYNASSANITSLYNTAIEKGASTIIGPFDKNRIASLARSQLSKPVLGLNYISGNSNSQLKQFGLLPEDEAVQLAKFAISQGNKRVAILAPNSSWGHRLRDAMRQAVIERGGKVVILKSYLNDGINFLPEAQNLAFRSNDLDAILMAAAPSQARRLYPSLRQELKTIPIYATSHVFNGVANAGKDANLDGLIFTEIPWILEMLQKNSTPTSTSPRLYAMGMDAYKIATQMESLSGFGSSFKGKTGKISLGSDGNLHRALRWAQFKNGVPVPFGG